MSIKFDIKFIADTVSEHSGIDSELVAKALSRAKEAELTSDDFHNVKGVKWWLKINGHAMQTKDVTLAWLSAVVPSQR